MITKRKPVNRSLSCKRCQSTFQVFSTRNIWFCPSCKQQIAKAANTAHRARCKQAAERTGHDSDKIGRWLSTLTVRTHEEVGQLLGISPQSSRMLERSALSKMRKAFAFELLQLQPDNSLRPDYE